jgi:hypothetical protein
MSLFSSPLTARTKALWCVFFTVLIGLVSFCCYAHFSYSKIVTPELRNFKLVVDIRGAADKALLISWFYFYIWTLPKLISWWNPLLRHQVSAENIKKLAYGHTYLLLIAVVYCIGGFIIELANWGSPGLQAACSSGTWVLCTLTVVLTAALQQTSERGNMLPQRLLRKKSPGQDEH